MKYIVVDLEMNPLSKEYYEERKQCRNEIIQIGAVVLDENYQEIGCFKTLVKPQYNEIITKKIEKLTGITTAMVQDAPAFEDAIHQFFSWCASINDVIEIHQWSTSDYLQVYQELCLKQIILNSKEQMLMDGWMFNQIY